MDINYYVNKLKQKVISTYQNQILHANCPLYIIISIAAIVRLLAVIFSKGYAMSDDHFVVIYTAESWLEGYNNWFNSDSPSHFSLVYPGLHYIFFWLLEHIGMTDLSSKMLLVRLIHGAYSLLIVVYGYLISLKLSDTKTAKQVGIFLALFWVLPFVSGYLPIRMLPTVLSWLYF